MSGIVRLAISRLALGAALFLSALPTITHAQTPPDALRLTDGAWMTELTALLRRARADEAHFILQNDAPNALALELELQPQLAWSPPPWMVPTWLLPAPRAPAPLRLIDSQGREFTATPAAPHRIAFTLPPQSATYLVLRAADGALPPIFALRLWAGAARQDFLARTSAVRLAAIVFLALLYAIGIVAALGARSGGGLAASLLGAAMLGIYECAIRGLPQPLAAVMSPLTAQRLLFVVALAAWLGFHWRLVAHRATPRRLRISQVIALLLNASLAGLVAYWIWLRAVPQVRGLVEQLGLEVLFASLLLALGLGALALALNTSETRK